MKILVSNDDGYFAPGLAALVDAVKPLGEVTVVAPEQNHSGASNSLTLSRPLYVRRAANGFYYVNGTPSDCVHLAVTGILEFMPDIVVSGINDGANMGEDTLYSGTVAAATEGYLLGIPSIAFSLTAKGGANLEAARQVAHDIVTRYLRHPLHEPLLLNVNIPGGAVQGLRATRLGKRHKAEPAVKASDPHGEPVYWVGKVGIAADDGPGTDFHATASGFVSVTPLQIDLTRFEQIDHVGAWLEK